MPLDLAQLATTEHDRAARDLAAPIPGVDPEAVVCRVTVRGEPVPWQRPAIINCTITDRDLARLKDRLLSSTDPPSISLQIWREEKGKPRTIPGEESDAAANTIRAFLRADIEDRGGKLGDPSIAVGLRVRFVLGNRTRPDLDNLVKTVCEALTGSAVADDRQVVSILAVKVLHDSDPRTEIILTREGVYR